MLGRFYIRLTISLIFYCAALSSSCLAAPGDIVFVTQTPNPADFATIGSTFGNQRGTITSAPRGGDLWIRYADGSLKNLTATAGFGVQGFQGDSSIAVRDPAVHWSGTKVIFSMVIGSAAVRYQVRSYYWQIYEITGLGKTQTPVITKIPNQPEDYNNVMPIYGTDDRIIYVSDRPRNGQRHLYPQLDEYESTQTNTGIWSLKPQTGNLVLLDHAPSGNFHPILDSYGRVVFTRWDHLQRDQQTDGNNPFQGFNYADETANAQRLNSRYEPFPEARIQAELDEPRQTTLRFNHFFPWQINEDGSEHETLNHIGRHELHAYFNRAFNDDGNLLEFNPAGRVNQNSVENFFHIREDPLNRAWYFGIEAPEFDTHTSGQIIKMYAPPHLAAAQMQIINVTHPETASPTDNPGPNHSGLYRNPLPLANGAIVAAHTTETRIDTNLGTRNNPMPRHHYRIKRLKQVGNYFLPDINLTAGINKNISYYDPDELVSYSGPMWELQPVELVARTRPAKRFPIIQKPERSVFLETGVDINAFRQFLFQNHLALIITRNVTTRDAADLQQPFNLRVTGTQTQTIAAPGKIYDVSHLQIFQGDQIRGYGGTQNPSPGRRIIPNYWHTGLTANPANPNGPQGSVAVASDGSIAAIVPARRPLSWQLTDASGDPVVRERYWLTFKPGEIRVCASCHGLTDVDQLGRHEPLNKPEALRLLLNQYKTNPPASNPVADPADPANPIFEQELRPPGPANQYLPWNGFLGMINILELTNKGNTSRTIKVGLYDLAGNSTNLVSVPLSPGEQKDLILNDLYGFTPDSYGLVTLDYSGDDIDGRVTYYRNRPASNNFDFAYTIPFQAPLTEASTVAFNTYQPSFNPTELNHQVANWLSIVNLDHEFDRSYTIYRHADDGSLVLSQRVTIPAFARVDIDGGHAQPGPFKVGLNRIVPDTVGKPYFAQLVRYGHDAVAGIIPATYSFAFPLFSRSAGAAEQFVPISTGADATNWLEVANFSNSNLTVNVSLYDSAGAVIANSIALSLPAYAQQHLNAGSYLPAGHSGTARLVASRANAMIANSAYYFPAHSGSIAAMYATASSTPSSGNLGASYNLFLNMVNWLKLNNTSNANQSVNIKVFAQGSFNTQQFNLAPRASLDLPLHDHTLFGTTENSYGLVEITGNSILGQVIRLRPNAAIADFAFPTPVQ